MIDCAKHSLGLLTDDQVKTLPDGTVVLVPLGSIEPHGHLPLATDSMIATEILTRVAQKSEDAWILPTIPVGYLFKYSQWSGAIGISSETMRSTIFEISTALARNGLTKLFVMSGHDENREPTLQGLREANVRVGTLSVYCDWLDLAVSLVRRISSSGREGHASEIQTAVFKYLFPDIPLVLPIVADCPPLKPGDDDLFAEGEIGTWVQSFIPGREGSFSGNPAHATVEKGRVVVDYIVERAGRIINELRIRESPTPINDETIQPAT